MLVESLDGFGAWNINFAMFRKMIYSMFCRIMLRCTLPEIRLIADIPFRPFSPKIQLTLLALQAKLQYHYSVEN